MPCMHSSRKSGVMVPHLERSHHSTTPVAATLLMNCRGEDGLGLYQKRTTNFKYALFGTAGLNHTAVLILKFVRAKSCRPLHEVNDQACPPAVFLLQAQDLRNLLASHRGPQLAVKVRPFAHVCCELQHVALKSTLHTLQVEPLDDIACIIGPLLRDGGQVVLPNRKVRQVQVHFGYDEIVHLRTVVPRLTHVNCKSLLNYPDPRSLSDNGQGTPPLLGVQLSQAASDRRGGRLHRGLHFSLFKAPSS